MSRGGPAGRRILTVTLAAAAAVVGVAAPATAAPATLSVSGLHEADGVVEFYLTARDLPVGTSFDRATVTVQASGVDLPVRVEVARPAGPAGSSSPRSAPPRTSVPLRTGVLVLDASASMAGAPLASAKQAALAYLDALPSDVRVGVVTVAGTATVALSPTADRAATTEAVNAITAAGKTALYDGIAAAAHLFGTAPTAGEERRILVLSDGADTASRTTPTQAASTVDRSRAVLDAVAFRTTAPTTAVLAGLVAPTGGHRYTAADGAALASAFRTAAGAFASPLAVTATVPKALAGKQTRLEVSATVAGSTVSTSVPITFAIDPKAAPVHETVAGQQPHLVWYAAIGLLVFLALLTFGLVLFAPLIDYTRHRRRVAQVDQFRVATQASADGITDRSLTQAALDVSTRVVRSGGLEARIADRLDRAGMRMRPSAWPLLRAAIGFGLGFLVAVFVHPVPGLAVGIVTGWFVPWAYLHARIDRRQQKFAAQLPDALQLVIGSLRSGFSLSQAIDATAREATDPLATEFSRALAETRLGVELEAALSRVAGRMNSQDLAWAVVVVRVQHEVGGNLAEVLSTTVATMRERQALRRQVQALAAEGKLSAYILTALPLVVALILLLTRPAYLAPLVTTPIGVGMLLVGIVLMVLGAFWMSRMIKVEA